MLLQIETPETEPVPISNVAALHRGASRLILVDVARVFAIVFMIQGHALDVLLAPAYRQGAFFNGWLFLRGLTAPLFFTLSGVSFTLSTVHEWQQYTRPTWKLLRRVGRFAFFVLLGYAMHLPAASLGDFQYVDAAGWQGWFQVDVLQCIGVALLALQVLVLLTGTPRRLAFWAIGLTGAVILLAPLVWNANWSRYLPLPAASYLNARTGSSFPLFPWVAYVFFGAAFGYVLREWSSIPSLAARRLAFAGAILGTAGLLLSKPTIAVYANLDYWKTSPALFLVRVACVCLLLSFFAWVTTRWRVPHGPCRSLAQESLLIYFVHVSLLYGSVWNLGLRHLIGSSLPPLPALGWIFALVLSMMVLAWTWSWFKHAAPRRSYLLRFALLLLAVIHPWF